MGRDSNELVRLHQAAQPGTPQDETFISDEQRLRQLSQLPVPGTLPPRQIHLGEEVDPFGLLEQDDSYEKLAGLIFTECEGIYHQLAVSRPEVGTQVRQAQKNPDQQHNVVLPTSQLSDLYGYEMVRAEDGASIQYLFHRTDKGYEDKGFRIMKKGKDDHVVINNLDVERDYTEEDVEYYGLLHVAKRWVQDYALAMNIAPHNLRNLAELPFKPYGFKSRAAHLGKSALGAFNEITRPARDVVTKITTVKKPESARRRPRLAALAVVAACVPLSPGTLGTDAASSAASGIYSALKAGPGFDSHHFQLPQSSEIPVGALGHKVKFDPTLSNAIYNDASLEGGTVNEGQIRRIDPATGTYDSNWDTGLPGIGKSNCKTLNINMPGAKDVRIVSTNPTMVNGLSVSVTNESLNVCNHTHHVMHEANTHIFIEPEG